MSASDALQQQRDDLEADMEAFSKKEDSMAASGLEQDLEDERQALLARQAKLSDLGTGIESGEQMVDATTGDIVSTASQTKAMAKGPGGVNWKNAALAGAAVAAVMGLISWITPDGLEDDLIEWLEDDGMDDAAQFVAARLQPGQRRG